MSQRSSLSVLLLASCLASLCTADPGVEHTMQLPGRSWAISVSIPGFQIEEQWTRKDDSGMKLRASNKDTGVIVSIYLEREKKPRSSAQCRTKYFNKALSSDVWKSKVKKWEAGPLALGQYMIESSGGVQLNQMHMNAYIGKDDVCVDIHLSKAPFAEADRPLFDAVVSSVKVVENEHS